MKISVTTDGLSGNAVVTYPKDTVKAAQRIDVARGLSPGELRVATVPEVVEKLIKLGFSVAVESGAGDAANMSDAAY